MHPNEPLLSLWKEMLEMRWLDAKAEGMVDPVVIARDTDPVTTTVQERGTVRGWIEDECPGLAALLDEGTTADFPMTVIIESDEGVTVFDCLHPDEHP